MLTNDFELTVRDLYRVSSILNMIIINKKYAEGGGDILLFIQFIMHIDFYNQNSNFPP